MTIVSALRHSSLLASLILTAAGANATVSFHLSVTTHRENMPGTKTSLPADDTQESDIVLEPQRIRVSGGKSMSVFDFAARRRYAIDKASGTYVNYSLFDTVGFRQIEMHNRQAIGGMLHVAKLDDRSTPRVFEEQALSVLAGKAPGQLLRTAQNGEALWSVDGKLLLSSGASNSAVSVDDARAFAQFLRYTWGGHPLVLDALAEGQQIPLQFQLHYQEMGAIVTRRFQVSAVTDSAPATFSLQAYQRRQAAPDAAAIEQLLDQAASLQPLNAQAHPAMRAEAERAFVAQQPLKALLIMLEDNLSTGALVQNLTPAQQLDLQANVSVQQFMHALKPPDNKEAMTEAADSLHALRIQEGGEQTLLKLFEANLRNKLGQRPAAIRLYIEVLQAKPHLAGAYKDMGDALYAQFEAAHAWRSWDAGRRLAPGLVNFSKVNQYEQSLLKEYPAFF